MDQAGGFRAPYWQDILNHPGIKSWWEPLIYQNKFDRVNLPIRHVSGWYDDGKPGR
jgi:predicted acyl esterase